MKSNKSVCFSSFVTQIEAELKAKCIVEVKGNQTVLHYANITSPTTTNKNTNNNSNNSNTSSSSNNTQSNQTGAITPLSGSSSSYRPPKVSSQRKSIFQILFFKTEIISWIGPIVLEHSLVIIEQTTLCSRQTSLQIQWLHFFLNLTTSISFSLFSYQANYIWNSKEKKSFFFVFTMNFFKIAFICCFFCSDCYSWDLYFACARLDFIRKRFFCCFLWNCTNCSRKDNMFCVHAWL